MQENCPELSIRKYQGLVDNWVRKYGYSHFFNIRTALSAYH
ncbi:MAG: hypothetical protein ACLFSY_09120 [Desulfonatronovibrionaceae bacterium]